MRGIVLAMALASSLSGVAQAQEMTGEKAEAVKKEIVVWENTKVKMFLSGNSVTAEWFTRALCDDVAYTGSDGTMRTKTQFLAELQSGQRKLHSMNHHDMHVRVYGTGNTPHTVVVTFVGDEVVEMNGKTYHSHDRATDVLIKDGNVWRVAAHQVTLISR